MRKSSPNVCKSSPNVCTLGSRALAVRARRAPGVASETSWRRRAAEVGAFRSRWRSLARSRRGGTAVHRATCPRVARVRRVLLWFFITGARTDLKKKDNKKDNGPTRTDKAQVPNRRLGALGVRDATSVPGRPPPTPVSHTTMVNGMTGLTAKGKVECRLEGSGSAARRRPLTREHLANLVTRQHGSSSSLFIVYVFAGGNLKTRLL